MPENKIYTGPIRVRTTDKDGKPYRIKNGKRAGEPWCQVSFKEGEDWVNLADFANSAAGWDGQVCKVAYSEKVDEFGDPVLYNGKPQYNLEAIKCVADTGVSQSGNAAPTGNTGSATDGKREDIMASVAAKCASEYAAALITCSDYAGDIIEDWDRMYDHVLGRLNGSSVAELAEKAKDPDVLGAAEADDDIPF
jgi:uncharacterized protein YkuJ